VTGFRHPCRNDGFVSLAEASCESGASLSVFNKVGAVMTERVKY
jgi:hypothetical protein